MVPSPSSRWLMVLLTAAGCAGDPSVCGLGPESVATVDSPHVDGEVGYDDLPPTSGPHSSCWGEWGVHTDPLPDENWVHNMEHGGVAYLYNCPDGCPNAVERLTALVEELGDFAILTPYAEMTWKYGVVSWGWREQFECVEEGELEQFYRDHNNDAPESSLSDPGEGCMD